MGVFESLTPKQQEDVCFAVQVWQEKLVSLEQLNESLAVVTQSGQVGNLGLHLVRKRLIKFKDFNRLLSVARSRRLPELEHLSISIHPDTGTIHLSFIQDTTLAQNSADSSPQTLGAQDDELLTLEDTAPAKPTEVIKPGKDDATALLSSPAIQLFDRDETAKLATVSSKREDTCKLEDDQKPDSEDTCQLEDDQTIIEDSSPQKQDNFHGSTLTLQALSVQEREDTRFAIAAVQAKLLKIEQANKFLQEVKQSKPRIPLGLFLVRQRVISFADFNRIQQNLEDKPDETLTQGYSVKLEANTVTIEMVPPPALIKSGEISWEHLSPQLQEDVLFACEALNRGLLSLDKINQAFQEKHAQQLTVSLGVVLARHRWLSAQELFQIKQILETSQYRQGQVKLDVNICRSADGSLMLRSKSKRQFGKYQIIREIARGGMGIVYEALDSKLGRRVALKTLILGEKARKRDVERFRREAQLAATLTHPAIIPIHEIGEEDGIHYFTMDFVEGLTLSDYLKKVKPTLPQLLEILTQSAEALDFAHRHNVVHRDIKPANIMISAQGQPVIMDFGLAKDVLSEEQLTISGVALGTPAYMAPEQAVGNLRAICARTDVYSLGAVMYESLTGRPPFTANTLGEAIRLVKEVDPVPPRRLCPSIPADVETICLKCLEKEPARRYNTAQEVADDIRAFLDGRMIQARPPSWSYRLLKWLKRNRIVAAAVACALLALILTVGVMKYQAYRQWQQQVEQNWVHLMDYLRPWEQRLVNTSPPPSFDQVRLAAQKHPEASQKRLARYLKALEQCKLLLELDADHAAAQRWRRFLWQAIPAVACEMENFTVAKAYVTRGRPREKLSPAEQATLERIAALEKASISLLNTRIAEKARLLADQQRELPVNTLLGLLADMGPLENADPQTIEHLEQLLHHKNKNVRRLALLALMKTKQPQAKAKVLVAVQQEHQIRQQQHQEVSREEVEFLSWVGKRLARTAPEQASLLQNDASQARQRLLRKQVEPTPYHHIYKKYDHQAFEQEIKNFDLKARFNPNNHYAYFLRAVVHMRAGRQSQAIRDFNHAIRLEPNLSAYYQGRGLAYYLQGNFKQALYDLNHAIQLQPEKASCYADRAMVYQKMNQYKQALADISKAIAYEKRNGTYYARRAWIYRARGEYDKAADDVYKGLKYSPHYRPLYRLRRSLRKLLHNETALLANQIELREMNSVISSTSRKPWSYYLLGRGWQLLTQLKKSQKSLARYCHFYQQALQKLLADKSLPPKIKARLQWDLAEVCFYHACYYALLARQQPQAAQKRPYIDKALLYLELSIKYNPRQITRITNEERLKNLRHELLRRYSPSSQHK